MVDVMIDIETKGKGFDSVVLTIGAVKFDPYSSWSHITSAADMPNLPSLYLLPDIAEQEIMGRTTDASTMEWWATQDAKVREEAFTDNGRELVETVLLKLFNFCEGADAIWAQGPQFDICILENLYRSKDLAKPWSFGQIRDSRTWLKAMGDTRDKNSASAHNALADAYSQAFAVQTGFNKLKEMKVLWTLTNGESTG